MQSYDAVEGKNLTVFCPYSGEAVIWACRKQRSLTLKETDDSHYFEV